MRDCGAEIIDAALKPLREIVQNSIQIAPVLIWIGPSPELRRLDRTRDDDVRTDGDHVADQLLTVARNEDRVDRCWSIGSELAQESGRSSGRQASSVELAPVPRGDPNLTVRSDMNNKTCAY